VGILIAALLASAMGAYAGASILKAWVGWDRCHVRVFAAALFFSPIVNLFAKKPVIEFFLRRFHLTLHSAGWPWWFAALVLLIVGVCEEGIKALPALVPSVRESIRSRASAAPMALTIGLGFALGEIWYVAYGIYQHDPAVANMPFYMLGGFVGERLYTIVGHSFFILLALRGLLPGKRHFVFGLGAAMVSHALADLPALLFQMKLVGIYPVSAILLVITIGCATPFYRYSKQLTSLNRAALLSTSSRVLYVQEKEAVRLRRRL
jgi:RsiW-degrading membrane proteinase PrsW (M82 family)